MNDWPCLVRFAVVGVLVCCGTGNALGAKPSTRELRRLPWVPWDYPAEAEDIAAEWTSTHMSSRPPRIVAGINSDWTLNYDSARQEAAGFAAPDFDDGHWQAVCF